MAASALPRQVTYEYRAVGQDEGDMADCGMWHRFIRDARLDGEGYEDAEPPFDRIWIERRIVVPEPAVELVETIR